MCSLMTPPSMAKNFRRAQRIASIGLVLGLIIAAIAAVFVVRTALFLHDAVAADALVVANREQRSRSTRSRGTTVNYFPTVEFTDASGRVHRVSFSVGSSAYD